MKQFSTGLVLALSLSLSATASADDTADPGADTPTPALRSNAHVGDNSCASAKKAGRACVLDFEDGDSVEGSVATGDGDHLLADSPAKHPSLIQLRMNFVDKILSSAEDVL